MSILEISGIIISLVTTFGPKAMDIYTDWAKTIPAGTDPTPEQWASLKAKIDSHDPDTY